MGKCKDTVIGTPGRVKGLSGGERKRLAFASEALTDPALLLCDEPTSGLDSFMAHSVLQVLKRLTVKEKTIILTIHQPSSELFGLFDKLLLVAEGRVAFLGTPAEAVDFFVQLNAPCPLNYNPADFYVQLLAIVPGKEEESRDTIRQICDSFASSPIASEISQQISALSGSSSEPLKSVNGNGSRGYRATSLTQFRAILWRSWLTVLKEPLLVKVRLIQTVVCVCNRIMCHLISTHFFLFTFCFADGLAGYRYYFLWPEINSGWCYEYKRSNFPISNQYDLSKRICSYKCKVITVICMNLLLNCDSKLLYFRCFV